MVGAEDKRRDVNEGGNRLAANALKAWFNDVYE